MASTWLLSACLLLGAAAPAVDTVVVCPDEFRPALAPWLEHRARQGHQIELVSNLGSPEVVRQRIRDVAERGGLRFVVLVGDADPVDPTDSARLARSVPAHLAEAQVNIHYGPERDIATDNWYADLDDDGLPELAIGRLTVDSADELQTVVGKILDYEQQTPAGDWLRRVNFVAGLGGFGQIADAVMEMSAKRFITEGIPPDFDVSMTYASWRSPYCPDPREFHDTTLRRLNEGSLFWVYIGHGQRRHVDRVRVPGGQYHIFGIDDVPKLNCEQGAPIAFFLACYTCAFDGPQDSLAEEMLRSEGAPVAIVGGSRVTMPYAMTVMAIELLNECFAERRETLGEALLNAKRAMVESDRRDEMSRSIDSMARTLNPTSTNLDAERREHVLLFNLVGDPLLRLTHVPQVEVETAELARGGETLLVSGRSPIDGQGRVELVVRRDRLTFRPPIRTRYVEDSDVLASFQDVYQRANDSRLASAPVEVRDGRFTVELAVPDRAHGPCHIRVLVSDGDQRVALGSTDLTAERRSTRDTSAVGQGS